MAHHTYHQIIYTYKYIYIYTVCTQVTCELEQDYILLEVLKPKLMAFIPTWS